MASIDLDKVLDKAWADKSLPEILAAPVAALKGVSDRDGELLDGAFEPSCPPPQPLHICRR
ncbi:hypothetical protein [Streptomyces flaveolus]|uniref:hypothetical protein n=1 Tax=Streptomyces flaveolus TaxID=67297 RepID=UPI0036F74D62